MKVLSQTVMISIHEQDRWQLKQDHFTEDSKHRQMKWLASTCLKVGIKCSFFVASQTCLCYIYFGGVFLSFSFPFCPCATLLYVVYSPPFNMATPGSWRALGRLEWHSLPPSALFCPGEYVPTSKVSSASAGSSLGQKKTQYTNCFLTFLLPILFLHSFSMHTFILPMPVLPQEAEKNFLCSPPFTVSCSCSVVV